MRAVWDAIAEVDERPTWAGAADSLADSLITLQRNLTSAERTLRQARRAYEQLVATVGSDSPSDETGIGKLTDQERRVGLLVALGKDNREIGRLLQVSVETVKSHLKHALDKLGLRSRWQLRERLKTSLRRSGALGELPQSVKSCQGSPGEGSTVSPPLPRLPA